MTRYYRNRTYRLARHITKRFQEQVPLATPTVVEQFKQLARQLYAAKDPQDIQNQLMLIEDFCKDVVRGQKGNEAAGEGTSREVGELVPGQPGRA